ncbi:MAG: 50S ribosomal protein L25 [Bdellovibrio sp.]|nr:50S ribosomal protein L25 [Bdellovibrio sp.]
MDMTIEAKKRNDNVKASTLRREGQVPGCLYGKGVETIQIQIPAKTVKSCLQKHAKRFNVKVQGLGTYAVGLQELQKSVMGDELIHISLHILNSNEITHLTVPIYFVGKAKGTTAGGILKETCHEVTIKGYPKDLVDEIKIDVTNLELGDNIHVKDIAGKYKFAFDDSDLDKVLVSCNYPKLKTIETTETATTVEAAVATDETTANADGAVNTGATATTEKAHDKNDKKIKKVA